MEFVKIHNKGHLGGNPYIACRRFAAGMRLLRDYERSMFCERYRCCLNRDVRTTPNNSAAADEATATDRYMRAVKSFQSIDYFFVVRSIVLEDKSPTVFARLAHIKGYARVYRLLRDALDCLDAFYEQGEK